MGVAVAVFRNPLTLDTGPHTCVILEYTVVLKLQPNKEYEAVFAIEYPNLAPDTGMIEALGRAARAQDSTTLPRVPARTNMTVARIEHQQDERTLIFQDS